MTRPAGAAPGGAPPWPYAPGKICVSVAADSVPAIVERLGSLEGADLVEVRLDALSDPPSLDEQELRSIVAGAAMPLGFTLRPEWQHGGYDGDEHERRRLLELAAGAGAAFVDVELEADWIDDFVAVSPCPVVASHHWQEPDPVDLADRVERIGRLGPSVAKLVGTAATAAECLPLLGAGRALHAAGQPSACFCMGEGGAVSRLRAVGYGAALVYAAPTAAEAVAAGQWTLDDLTHVLRVAGWRPGDAFCGVIGHPIGHSLSPAIFNAVAQQQRAGLAYVPLAGAELDPVLEFAEATEFRGLSVTMPFKEQMAARCNTLDALAADIGAVNTVVASDGGWRGANTDATAIVEAVETARPVSGADIALVGAGGAARAAAVALQRAGASVVVLHRTAERAAEVADVAGADAAPLGQLAEQHFDVVINATPVGMQGGEAAVETPFPVGWLRGTEAVVDMVYRPRRTVLLQQAAARGCDTVEGLEMFVRQAAAQYRLLTGDSSIEPLAALRGAALATLGENADEAQNGSADGIV